MIDLLLLILLSVVSEPLFYYFTFFSICWLKLYCVCISGGSCIDFFGFWFVSIFFFLFSYLIILSFFFSFPLLIILATVDVVILNTVDVFKLVISIKISLLYVGHGVSCFSEWSAVDQYILHLEYEGPWTSRRRWQLWSCLRPNFHSITVFLSTLGWILGVLPWDDIHT